MKGRITRKNSPTETIDNTTVINRSRLTSDMLIILLSLHYTFQLIGMIFFLPHFHPVKFLYKLMNKKCMLCWKFNFGRFLFPFNWASPLPLRACPLWGQAIGG